MEEIVFEALKNKKNFTPQDIHSLLILCDRLFKRNREIGEELQRALSHLDSMENRLRFYRQSTMKEIK